MVKAAIIGYGISGCGASRMLEYKGITGIDYYDDTRNGCLPLSAYEDKYDITVMSPGIPFNKLPVVPSEYTSELELAYEYMPAKSNIIGVTGTNGKSTVTSLTAQILNNAGISAVPCGNIGYAFTDAVLDTEPDYYVVELSSFQLELLRKFSMKCGAVVNLSPDHLDRYASYDDYAAAKMRIADFIDDDGVMVADSDSKIVNKMLSMPYKVRYVDRALEAWPHHYANVLNFGAYAVDMKEYGLFGRHNIINLAFSLSLAAFAVGLEGDLTPFIKNLKGLPHRTERFFVKDGVTWIDDSKATNVDSTLTALKSTAKPSILLLGGRDKKGDFTRLVEDIDRACSRVIAFGEAGDLIKSQLEGKTHVPLDRVPRLYDAVLQALIQSDDGTTVLLSPGCASYDEFSNFAERGSEFKRYVGELTEDD